MLQTEISGKFVILNICQFIEANLFISPQAAQAQPVSDDHLAY